MIEKNNGSTNELQYPGLVLAVAVVAFVLSGNVLAASVFQSIGDDGVPSYSATPPTDGRHYQILELNNDVPPAQHAAALEARDALLEKAARSDAAKELKLGQRLAAVKAARTRLAAAEKSLREGSSPGDSDWQRLANGKRHLTESYFARVAALKQAVNNARAELLAAHRQR